MSTLKTNNIEHLDAATPSIQTTIGGGVVFAGLSTFQSDARFDGNVNIAGTVTYDDVTNIDSVGLITARIGVSYGAPGAATVIDGNATGIGIGTDNPSDDLSILATPNSLVIGCKDSTRGNHVFQLLADDPAGNGELRLYQNAASGTHAKTVEIASFGNSYINSGSVGIGTDNPSQQKLTIDVNSSGTTQASFNGINICNTDSTTNNGSAIIFGQAIAGNSNARIGAINSDRSGNSEDQDIFFGTIGAGQYAERMRINSNGKVAIGAVPASGWQASSTSNVLQINNSVLFDYSSVQFDVGHNYYYDGTDYRYIQNGDAQRLVFFDRNFIFNRVNDGVADATISWSESMRLDSAGRLLLGVTSDFVDGDLQVVNGDGGQLNLGRSDTTVLQDNDLGQILFTGNGGSVGHTCASIRSYADNDHTSTSKSSRIDFYTTADSTTTQVKRLTVDSNGKVMQYASAGTDGYDLSNSRSAGTSTANFVGRFGSSGVLTGTVSMACYTNGNIVNTNGSYTQISDISLKENIIDAPSQWNDLKAVKFRKFNFKESTGYETFTQIGVVAQELELTSPGLVYDAATPGEPGNAKKAVKSSILTMKALVALQEAMARIETLEAEVAALKGS